MSHVKVEVSFERHWDIILLKLIIFYKSSSVKFLMVLTQNNRMRHGQGQTVWDPIFLHLKFSLWQQCCRSQLFDHFLKGGGCPCPLPCDLNYISLLHCEAWLGDACEPVECEKKNDRALVLGGSLKQHPMPLLPSAPSPLSLFPLPLSIPEGQETMKQNSTCWTSSNDIKHAWEINTCFQQWCSNIWTSTWKKINLNANLKHFTRK